METDDSIVKDFLAESYENLERVDQDLLALEQDPGARELLDRVFRSIHTIKGTCGFLGFEKLQSLSHHGENLLHGLRDGSLRLDREIASALLALVDGVRALLGQIEKDGSEGEARWDELEQRLDRLRAAPAAQPAPPAPARPVEDPPPDNNIGDILIQKGRVSADDVAQAVSQQREGDPRHVGEILVAKKRIEPNDVVDALQLQKETRATTPAAESSVRVDVELLDHLMNLVGELVLARNQVRRCAMDRADRALAGATQRLSAITSELQEGVMKTRMQPIANAWARLPRLVRDLCVACGKSARLETAGSQTELDRTLLEAIKDPLTHLVRNAVDHGIEAPAARSAAGKPEQGAVRLRACHEGGQVIVEIADDGAGIRADKVRAKALANGLVDEEQAAALSDREVLQLIFLPGLSTAEAVTNVSGRGVGMDVVKTNIEKIGGTIELDSRPGLGTTVRIRIPLTLAIVPALIVTGGGQRYAIPQLSLVELVRLEGEQVRRGVEWFHDAPVFRVRGRLLPLLHLERVLSGSAPAGDIAGAADLVVLQSDGGQFGLVVDRIADTEEIVVKPLSPALEGIAVYAGVTIMGDGRVTLILDVGALARLAGVDGPAEERRPAPAPAPAGAGRPARERLLLFEAGREAPLAVPLAAIARLEEFPRGVLERSAGRCVVRYRGGILPLVRLSEILPGSSPPAPADRERVQVIVHETAGTMIGLVVDRIVDVVEESLAATLAGGPPGIAGSAVIRGKVTELLDVPAALALAVSSWPDAAEARR
ncbi:MAG: chemotaxis protein CheA [Acidobacteria bacterium]|nr:chemotaxis protein CheA [Acidobacteriota bacterium]